MSVKKIFLAAFFCNLFYSELHAQADARLPRVIQPSPNAAAIQKFGDLPVSAYSGMPDIFIPIYTIESGGLSVPVSLNYNSSGIRVAEEASRVGLGWVLNTGGVISRTVIGEDDFGVPTYSYNNQTIIEIPKAPRFDQGSGFNIREGCDVTLNGYGINYSIPSTVFSDGNNYDLQPDIYTYNCNGHSGKFALRRNRDVILNSIEKIDIRVLGSDAKSWEIKTADGVLYKFELFETYIDYGGIGIPHKSSWYLTRIIAPTGHTIDFVYSTLPAFIHSIGSYFESKPEVNLASNATGATAPIPLTYYSAAAPGKWYSNLYLSKIIFDNGEVQFNYLADRLDIEGDVKLSSIRLFSKNAGESAQLIKTWNFSYSYFEGTNPGGGFNANASPDNLSKRLKLVSLQETGSSSSLPPYQFFYNNEADVPLSLPGKLSFSRDHWGYYNGKNNSSLIPAFIHGCNNDPVAFYLGVMGSERDPDPRYNQLFNLNKIKFPTGGFTTFEYETHDFDITNSTVNDHSYFASYTGTKPAVAEAGFSNIETGGNFASTLDLSGMVNCGQAVPLVASFIKLSGLAPGSGITYSLKNSSGMEVAGGYIDSYLGSTSPPMTEYLGTQQTNSGLRMTLNKLLVPDIYTWSFFVPANVNLRGAGVYISYSKNETFDPINNSGQVIHNALFGGGLRIRQIKDYSDEGILARVRKYNYHYESNGKVYSYGRRMSKPNYSYFVELTGIAGEDPKTGRQIIATSNILVRESDSNIPLNGSAGGSAVGYDKVEELFGENGENGKTVYEYYNQPDVIFNYTQFKQVLNQLTSIPRKPPFGGSVPNICNGSLIAQTDYAFTGGIYKKLKELTNTYQDLILAASNAAVLGIEKRANAGSDPYGAPNCYITNYVYPAITENRYVLTSSVSRQYDVSTVSAPVVTTTEYAYDNSTHLQLMSKKQNNSIGDDITTYFTYAADYPDVQCDAALMQMKGAAFMHSLPVTSHIIINRGSNQLLTKGAITKYQIANGKIFSKERSLLETNQPINVNTSLPLYNPASGSYPSGYFPRIIFDSYDNFGNILQMHKSDDINMSYVWDYSNSYPVAEITGAPNTAVAYTSFESDGTGNWNGINFSNIQNTGGVTGLKHYSQTGFNLTKAGLDPSDVYAVTYWTRNPFAYSIAGTQAGGPTELSSISTNSGTWRLYHHLVTGQSTITISGSGAIDELRLYPKTALMTTYTYTPLVGISSQCDVNNRITYYEYDSLGRLKFVRDQNRNIIKAFDYKYASQ